jgi:hypothetical protein
VPCGDVLCPFLVVARRVRVGDVVVAWRARPEYPWSFAAVGRGPITRVVSVGHRQVRAEHGPDEHTYLEGYELYLLRSCDDCFAAQYLVRSEM